MAVLVNITHDSSTTITDHYDGSENTDGDISITTGAALAGTTNGLNIVINDGTNWFAYKDFTLTTNTLRGRIYVDPNGATGGNYDICMVLHIRDTFDGTGHSVSTGFGYRTSGNPYVIELRAVEDSATQRIITSGTLTDQPCYVEWQVTRATNATSNDGTSQLWVNGTSQGTLTDVDNYDRWASIYRVHVGKITRVGTFAGTVFADELIINDNGNTIGGVSASASTSASQSQTPSSSPSGTPSASESSSPSSSESSSASPSMAVNLEQEGFRFRKDDGDEATATWLAAQDAPATIFRNTNVRLRFVVNATSGDAPSTQFKLQYKKSADEVWLDVPSSE